MSNLPAKAKSTEIEVTSKSGQLGGFLCDHYTDRKRSVELFMEHGRSMLEWGADFSKMDITWAKSVLKNLDANPEIEFEVIQNEDLLKSSNHCLLLAFAYKGNYTVLKMERFDCYRIMNKNKRNPIEIKCDKKEEIPYTGYKLIEE